MGGLLKPFRRRCYVFYGKICTILGILVLNFFFPTTPRNSDHESIHAKKNNENPHLKFRPLSPPPQYLVPRRRHKPKLVLCKNTVKFQFDPNSGRPEVKILAPLRQHFSEVPYLSMVTRSNQGIKNQSRDLCSTASDLLKFARANAFLKKFCRSKLLSIYFGIHHSE